VSGLCAYITNIFVISGRSYVVEYATEGFEPKIVAANVKTKKPVFHVEFRLNEQARRLALDAGLDGGPWPWDLASGNNTYTFTDFAFTDDIRAAGGSDLGMLCIVVASNSTVKGRVSLDDTTSCVDIAP
jgi:hypothetical protein